MGEFSKWLIHEDQKELFDVLFALALTLVFLVVSALLLWPLGRVSMTWGLVKGYWIFCIVLYWTAVLMVLILRRFHLDLDSHFDACVLSSLVLSGFVLAGWSAFAALTVQSFAGGASGWGLAILYPVGFFSCYVAYIIVSALYPGSIYRMVNLFVAHIAFIMFSAWPTSGRAIYGWFFDLF